MGLDIKSISSGAIIPQDSHELAQSVIQPQRTRYNGREIAVFTATFAFGITGAFLGFMFLGPIGAIVGAVAGVAFGVFSVFSIVYYMGRHERALNNFREPLVDDLTKQIDQREKEGDDVSGLKKQAQLLSSENPHLKNEKPDIDITHETLNHRTGMREAFLSKLQRTVLDVAPEYRFQMATILIGMNALSKDELDTFVFYLITEEKREIKEAVEKGEPQPFAPSGYERLKNLNIPNLNELPYDHDLNIRSREFLKSMGQEVSLSKKQKALREGRPTEEELKKLCK